VFTYGLPRWNNDGKPKHFSHTAYVVFDNQIVTVCIVYRRTRYIFLNYVGTRKRKKRIFHTNEIREFQSCSAVSSKKSISHQWPENLVCGYFLKRFRITNFILEYIYIYFFFSRKWEFVYTTVTCNEHIAYQTRGEFTAVNRDLLVIYSWAPYEEQQMLHIKLTLNISIRTILYRGISLTSTIIQYIIVIMIILKKYYRWMMLSHVFTVPYL